MPIKKGSGFSKILDEVFSDYSNKNDLKGKDPTDITSDIFVIAQEKYFNQHPTSKKTFDELISGSIGDKMSEKVRKSCWGK